MRRLVSCVSMCVVSGLLVGSALAGDDAGEGKQKKERKAKPERVEKGERGDKGKGMFMSEEIRNKIKEFRETERKENREKVEALLGGDDMQAACRQLIALADAQHQARKTFHAGLLEDIVAEATAKMAEESVPQEKQDEILGKIRERHEKMSEYGENEATTLKSNLTALLDKEDLTKKDLMDAWRSGHEGGRGKGPKGKSEGENRERKHKEKRRGGDEKVEAEDED